MTTTLNLQERLTAVVLADPDVLTLYPARTAVREIAINALSPIVELQDLQAKVLVSESEAGTSVTISVGVTGERSAAAVCRDLHDRIAAELAGAAAPRPFDIAVRVSSIA